MRPRLEDLRIKMLEKCFDCFCKNGLENTSTKKLAEACGMTDGNIFHYFASKDEIIIKSTADIKRFLEEVPYWTAKKHGKKYRFMYQVYASPKYREYGKEFFAGVTKRYTEYAKSLEPTLGIPWQTLQPLIYMFVRACVHYALFEDEDYLKPQIALIGEMLPLITEKYAVK